MKQLIIGILLFSVIMEKNKLQAQDLGVSFSFFFPKNGYFSAPISPFSLRGIGVDLTNNIAIETGFTVYRMSGMNVENLPFESKEPIIGPFFNFLVPLELILETGNRDMRFRLKAGGFAFYNFGTKINNGNLDRALRDYLDWEIANAEVEIDNKIGLGYEFGAEYILYFSKQFGVSLGANYYIGGADLNMRGTVNGGSEVLGIVSDVIDYPESRLDYTGLEISIGVIFSGR